MTLLKQKRMPSLEIILLVLISGVVFLPYISRLSYFLDDWYYVYDGVVFGPSIFHSMFSIDRPARGYFFDLYFSLFGPNPFPYHLGAYAWRLLAGFCAFRVFNILWPENKRIVFFSSLLFVLYPGYSWWISGIEYQPMIASLALQVFSCWMTLEAIRSSKDLLKIVFLSAAILSGWAYIALVEYAIGMEVFRFICVYLLVSQTQPLPILKKMFVAVRAWIWNLVIPLGFLAWRLFFFENQRKATDINLMLNTLRTAPVKTLLQWSATFFESLKNAGIYAWFKQLSLQLSSMNFGLSNMGLSVVVIAISVLLGLAVLGLVNSTSSPEQDTTQKKSSKDAIVLGLLSLLAGVVPVIVANRYINLSFYSHYGLPVSLAAAVFLVGFVSYVLPSKPVSYAILSVFVVLSAVTHSLIAEKTIILENSLENFWWQVSWRIPDIQPDSTFVTLYPYKQVADNEFGPAGPVALIYFPEAQSQTPIRYPVSTLLPTKNNADLILADKKREAVQYRVHKKIIRYDNIVVLSQPTIQSCVRVIGSQNSVFSNQDPENIRRISSRSRIENIRLLEDEHTPPEFAFGPEPEHGWCYFFEKADLAVQRLDWQGASKLGDNVLAQGLKPVDIVEWFPYIQAYAMMADQDKLEAIALQTEAYPSFERQVCELFRDPSSVSASTLGTGTFIEELFCN